MKHLRELRTLSHLSLRAVQENTGIDFSRLAVIEKTEANINAETVKKLSLFFSVTESYILTGKGGMFFYDEKNARFFTLSDEQFPFIKSGEAFATRIENKKIYRILTLDSYDKLDSYFQGQKKALSNRTRVNQFIDFLETLDNSDFRLMKDVIEDYFSIREVKGG